MWDETAHRIVCYRVLDGLIHHGHDIPPEGLPPLEKEVKFALMRQAQLQLLAGPLAVPDCRVVPVLREIRRQALFKLHAANVKAGIHTVATVEELEPSSDPSWYTPSSQQARTR